MAAQILSKREWLEKLRLSDDPDAQRFAAEALEDEETLEAAATACGYVTGLPEEKYRLDPVQTIERLDAAVAAARADYESVRFVLVQTGALAADDKDTPVADLLRALLAC